VIQAGLTGFQEVEVIQNHVWQAGKRFPQQKSNVLWRYCGNRKQNTTYSGLNLTCTIDSGIFPTAAVNGL